MVGNLLMLVRSSAARAVRSNTRTATPGVRVLLESSVARVLLSVAAAAATECSCARDCLATRNESTLYPPRTYLVDFFKLIRPGKEVQITQIPLRCTPVKYPPHTDPSRLNMMQISLKYPDFTDPPDHTTIPQVMQILQIMQTHRKKCAFHADRTYPIPVYRSYRPYRFHSGTSYRSCRLY